MGRRVETVVPASLDEDEVMYRIEYVPESSIARSRIPPVPYNPLLYKIDGGSTRDQLGEAGFSRGFESREQMCAKNHDR
ncbi:predicted protein [Plenodomus lingam JN3]|uniref:Predicted protein n=1 Tax=Leptosphaeria maculans (strain JN3 / isolate v23.1.3 / race Av1-4-5-6-7-8) TaxID=985895 RepID=E5ADL5_LEPMJ|nr:predicted protein [Plenodomus lingam JN3]CBY01304.1 predicted protein [Plenodomus lingam JN3]